MATAQPGRESWRRRAATIAPSQGHARRGRKDERGREDRVRPGDMTDRHDRGAVADTSRVMVLP